MSKTAQRKPSVKKGSLGPTKKLMAAKAAPVKSRKQKEAEPAVSSKDYKLLWGRSAARCAFPDCRIALTEAKGTATYGNVCHIVAESSSGPRGDSILDKKGRNSYPNLILMCSHHHDVIDAIPSGPKNYPIELLHQFKAAHELWVENTLGEKSDGALLVYASVIDDISSGMNLDHWGWFSDHVIRDLLHHDAVDCANHFERRLKQIIWPKKFSGLMNAAIATMGSFIRFVRHFESFCEIRSDNFLQADRQYKRITCNPDYDQFVKIHITWSKLSRVYFDSVVVELNEFANQVRSTLNPHFFSQEGRFLVGDDQDAYSPERSEVQAGIIRMEKEWKEVRK